MSFLIHRVIPAATPDAPAISALDRGVQLGDGVFDTMVCFGGNAFLGDRHLDRLLRHASIIGIATDGAIIKAVLASALAEVGKRHAIVRTTLTRGQAARGLWPTTTGEPSLVITAQPWTESLVGQPAQLAQAGIPRNQYSPLARIKSLAYLENILAAREAAEAGADDALIRNIHGDAVSTTIANIFAVDGKRLITPPLADGCLEGVTRGLVLEEARQLGLACREESFTPQTLARVETLFLTNSVRLIRPVTAIAGRALSPSPMVGRLLCGLLARIARDTAVDITAVAYNLQ